MRKYYCDSCREEVAGPNVFEVPCHLYSLKHKNGYVDNDGNHVSMRKDQIDLCNACLNKAYSGALEAIGLNEGS